jgi:hypothetical protein
MSIQFSGLARANSNQVLCIKDLDFRPPSEISNISAPAIQLPKVPKGFLYALASQPIHFAFTEQEKRRILLIRFTILPSDNT